MKYIPRALETQFLEASKYFGAILLTGARQVGKTTMLQHLAEGTDRTYVSLEDSAAVELARRDPQLFFRTYPPPVLVDEVQYAPGLFPEIKQICDERKEPGMFWLTGSEHYRMIRNVQQSMAGRVALMTMYSLSSNELSGTLDGPLLDYSFEAMLRRQKTRRRDYALFERIWRGGMPGMQNMPDSQRRNFFSSYVETYISRDAADFGAIEKLDQFRQFIKSCAALTGQTLNCATLAQTSGISQPTAKNWIRILQSLGIVYLLQPYENNRLKRLAKTPKLYFCDTGLAAYLTSWLSPETLRDGAASGAFFETYIVMELVKTLSAGSVPYELFYYREGNRKEIDVFVQIGDVIHPLEIKCSCSPRWEEISKFDVLDSAGANRGPGGIVCQMDRPLPITSRDSFIPYTLL